MDQFTPAGPATPQGPTTPTRRGRRTAVAAALVAAGALGGGVLAGTLSASADTTATTGSSTPAVGRTQEQTGAAGQGPRGGGQDAHGSAAARSDETVLTGADAERAKAAALEAVPGGTVYRVETDAGDAEYEAHATKADGTEVTVKLDADFAVVEVQDGMGKGDPALPGPHGRGGESGQQGDQPAVPSATPSAAATG